MEQRITLEWATCARLKFPFLRSKHVSLSMQNEKINTACLYRPLSCLKHYPITLNITNIKSFRWISVADHGKVCPPFFFRRRRETTNLIDNEIHVTAETIFIPNILLDSGKDCNFQEFCDCGKEHLAKVRHFRRHFDIVYWILRCASKQPVHWISLPNAPTNSAT